MCRIFFIIIIFCCTFESSGWPQENEPLFQQTSQNKWVVVDKILRADRVLLKNGERVQLIGLEAPEMSREFLRRINGENVIDEAGVDLEVTIEQESFIFTKRLLEGKKVRLELDVQKKTESWDTFAYLFLEDGTFVNVEILRQGFAYLHIRPPNMKYAQKLREAYQESKKELNL